MVKRTSVLEKRQKLLEKIAYCGDTNHKIINAGLHTYPMGQLTEDAYPLGYTVECDTCRTRFEAATRAFHAGKTVGSRGR
jgi:hypothetical protein